MKRLPLDYALRNLLRRRLRTILTGLACALVAGTLAANSAFVASLRSSFASAGRDDVAILLSKVAERDVARSTVAPAVEALVAADVKAVARPGGEPAVSGEIHLATHVVLERDPAREPRQAMVRGVGERAFFVHDAVTILEGRPPRTGEVIAGRLAAAKLGVPDAALAIGARVEFEGATYAVAGRFAAPGTTLESELWTPVRPLQAQTRRDDVSAVFVRLDSPDAVGDVELFARRRLDLELNCMRSSTYYRELAAYFGPIGHLAWMMALLIAGAVLATGANTLSTAVQDRMRELATLRAIGYTGPALVLSLLQEALLLAAGGGLFGLLLAWLLVDRAAFRIGMSAFALHLGAASLLAGMIGVLLLGAIGTLPAALRIARMPVASALKEAN